MCNKLTVARVYATAVFDLSLKQKNINQWYSSLELFSKISKTTLFKSLCLIERDINRLSEFLIMIFEDCYKKNLNLFEKNFIYIIVKNQRILLLSIIFEEFKNLYNNYMKFIVIEVISARPLSDNQLKKIIEIMTHRLSKTVKIICRIDIHILAGIIIKIKDIIIDASLKGRISRLSNALKF